MGKPVGFGNAAILRAFRFGNEEEEWHWHCSARLGASRGHLERGYRAGGREACPPVEERYGSDTAS